jgi:hypothetical protein
MKTTLLTTDEYIFLSWIRSLTNEQRDVLLKYLKNGNKNPADLSRVLAESYPHNLLNIARTIRRN